MTSSTKNIKNERLDPSETSLLPPPRRLSMRGILGGNDNVFSRLGSVDCLH